MFWAKTRNVATFRAELLEFSSEEEDSLEEEEEEEEEADPLPLLPLLLLLEDDSRLDDVLDGAVPVLLFPEIAPVTAVTTITAGAITYLKKRHIQKLLYI